MTHAEAVNTLASERYLLDEMTDAERGAYEAHFFECAECADDVRAGALMRDGARAGVVSGSQVVRPETVSPSGARSAATPVRQVWYRSSALPWAVAATLAVVVGYQSQRPTSDGGAAAPRTPEALTAVMLRPASRGAVPTVSLASNYAALALDVDAAGATDLSYELRDAGSAVLASGRAPAPAAGSPLLIVIPTFALRAQQQYHLSVRGVSATDRVLGDYYFAAAP